MNVLRIVLIMIAWTLAGPALPQTGERGSIPPGTSQDGSRPADGAIKGGAILPGETAGVPGKAKCEELTGTLREDCLKQEREAGTGGTDSGSTDSRVREMPPSPPLTTPPQNPVPGQR
jgi:hypothetical protein